MNARTGSSLLAIFALALIATAHSEPTPISAGLHLSALADPHVIFGEEEPNFSVIVNDEEFQVDTLDPMRVSVDAVSADGSARVRTTGSGRARWKSPSEGIVIFHLGWKTHKVIEDGRAGLTGGGNFPDWLYAFVPDVDSVFTLKWHIVGGGSNPEGLTGFTFDVGFGTYQTMDVDSEGSVSLPLVAGNTYILGLQNLAESDPTFIGFPLGTRSARMTAIFSWRIDPVPLQ